MAHQRMQLGSYGEKVVERYLEQEQFTILAKNFRKRDGEVDLIARKGLLTIFVEVKTRHTHSVDPTEIITPAKQRKIARAAAFFTAQEDCDYVCRFDVAVVTVESSGPSIMYIADAFQAEG
jgi:putative endonuclease